MHTLVGILVGATLCLAGAASAEPAPVTLCHHPPGNPELGITLTVGGPSVPAHLAHGDTLGPCPCVPTTCAAEEAECGEIETGCGGIPLFCGDCKVGVCEDNQCVEP